MNPHMDLRMQENGRMEKHLLRQILARNITQAMERKPDVSTQPALAEKAGIAQSHVSRILNCQLGAGLDKLAELSEALDCEPWELLVDEEATRERAIKRMIQRAGHNGGRKGE